MILPYILFLFYLIALIASCVYAIRRGGPSEKYGATIMLVGSFLTAAAGLFASGWHHTEGGVLLVDLSVLAAFLTLALTSDKYWPLWTTAFQIIGVATHLARFVDPAIIPRAYSIAQGFWAYPMLAALVIGAKMERPAMRISAARY
jgi:hypothetical protein